MSPSQAENPPPAAPSGGVLDRALALAAFLRARCPWDAAQTPLSLQPYLLEEAHEAIEAIESGDPAHMQEELGDLQQEEGHGRVRLVALGHLGDGDQEALHLVRDLDHEVVGVRAGLVQRGVRHLEVVSPRRRGRV